MNMLKRFLALLLVVCMMLVMAPVSAFAVESEPTEVEETTVPTTVPETVPAETTEATTSTESTVGTVPEESDPDDETLPEEALFSADGIDVQALTMGDKPADGTTYNSPFPQGTGGSNSFRIPAMVTLNDGTIVAAADARWNTTYDGGGLDTIVSRSTDNGATWYYTFANYLGDNGNVYNGSGSTAFIDPCLATDGNTVYMLCDLYPYGVALNGSGNTAPSTAVGFNSDGTLKLAQSGSSSYNYYLKDGQIYDSTGSVVSGYTVDAYFNITGNSYNTNLFFSDSPFKVVRTGYLYLTSSTDGGKSWSAPTLIPNVKKSSEQVCLVGPGRGLVTDGKIIFPVYSYNGSAESQRMGFIYSTNGGASWMRVDSGISWSSEAAVVQLDNGTLRFFYRNGTSRLCYVDYVWGSGWSSTVNTGIATNSNTQISAISYSGRVDGKQVILVSCPAGSGSSGSNQSGASYRLNGKIFAGLINSDYTMDWNTGKTVSLDSKHSSTNYFMYSCLTELRDGSVAVLYEDEEHGWGVDCYYQMTYANIDRSSFGLTFDTKKTPQVFVFRDEATGVEVTVTAENGETYDGWTLMVTPNQTVDGVGNSYAAYRISLADASGTEKAVTSASVSLPVGNLDAGIGMCAFAVPSDGEIAELEGTLSEDGKFFTFTADLPGTVGIAVNDMTSPDMITKDIVLTVGDSQTVTDETGDYENSYTGEGLDTAIATVKVTGTTVGGTAATPERTDKVTSLTAGTYIIGNGSQWLTLNGSSLSYTTDPTKATQWTIAQSGSSWTIKSGSNCLYYSSYSGNLSVNSYNPTYWNYDGNGFYYTNWRGTSYYLRWSGSAWQVSTSSSNRGAAYTYTPATEGTEGKASTEIVFTGVSAGTTSVTVGSTVYNITVNRKALTVNLAVGSTETFQDSGAPMVEDDTIASATLSGGTLAITGLAEGTTTVTTDTAVYTVNVSTATHLTVAQGSSLTISTPLENGQYVKWSSEDSSYVGVAGVYDATKKAYTNEADVFGQEVTETPIEVTGTIYNSDGSVASVAKWRITVTEPEAGTVPVIRYYDVDHVENCVLYYSINGGRLVQVNGTGVSIIPGVDEPHTIIDGTWHGDMSLMFFAAPNEGYALTHLFVEDSEGQYYVLSDGEDSDVTKSSAWPFREDVDPENLITVGGHTYSIEEVASLYRAGDTSIYRQVNQDSSIWKTIDGSLHGFRWALLEGYVSPTRLKELLTDAHAKGCTGIATVTKGSTNHTYVGTAADPVSICTIAQKLATVDKVVEKLTDADGKDITQDGIVKIGDTVTYKVTVTVPATSEVVKYWDGSRIVSGSTSTVSYTNMTVADSLSDYSPDFNWTQRSVTSSPTAGSDQIYTVTYSVPLTAQNFGDIVTGGTITNVAALSYDYRASLGKGTHKSSAEKQLDVTVEIPSYVVDFGLPVNIDLTGYMPATGTIVACENGQYGTATLNGSGLTYTPTAILQGVDYVDFTYQLPGDAQQYGYKVAIYPATTVYYEEGFATYSGSWTGYGKGTGTQATQILGSSTDEYGYDSAYATGIGASGGTRATSETVGDSCSFTFTGTGFEIYADCAPGSGYLSSVVIRDENNTAVKAYLINTVASNGKTDATADQATNLYGLPIVSDQNLAYGTYKITVTHIMNKRPIYIDGIRIYGTMGADTTMYQQDLEDNPSFIELRDQVLASLGAQASDSQQYADQIASNAYSQVYGTAGNTQGVVITSVSDRYTDEMLTDLLDNGPKNEIFLRSGQALTFTITTDREVQLGLKAPDAQTSCTIQADGASTSKAIGTSTDMFYTVLNRGTSAKHTVTVTNTGNSILSVTKLKVCDDPNAALGSLTESDLVPAMESLGFAKKPGSIEPSTPDPVEPTQPEKPVQPEKPDVPKEPETPDIPAQPEQPTVSYADAALTVILVDYTGTPVSTARLTASGEEQKAHTFTAQELRSAAEGALPSGYAFVKEDAIVSAEVNYGEEGTVKVQVGRVAVLNVTYVSIFGKKVGSATITKVQTSAGSCRISASEIREVAPNGRRAVWLTSVKVPFGSERSIIVSAF